MDASSWNPGADWTDTVFEPMYRACSENPDGIALFFSLFEWQVPMDNDACGRYVGQ